MPLVDLKDLPPEGALLGLDPGARRIGVAATDAGRMLAAPVHTIARARIAQDGAQIFADYDSRDCAGIVIGLPLNMDDSEGPRAQSARAFARNLLKLRDVPIALHDERLTSAEAEERLRAMGVRAGRRGEMRDQIAAMLILEDALRAMAEGRPGQV